MTPAAANAGQKYRPLWKMMKTLAPIIEKGGEHGAYSKIRPPLGTKV